MIVRVRTVSPAEGQGSAGRALHTGQPRSSRHEAAARVRPQGPSDQNNNLSARHGGEGVQPHLSLPFDLAAYIQLSQALPAAHPAFSRPSVSHNSRKKPSMHDERRLVRSLARSLVPSLRANCSMARRAFSREVCQCPTGLTGHAALVPRCRSRRAGPLPTGFRSPGAGSRFVRGCWIELWVGCLRSAPAVLTRSTCSNRACNDRARLAASRFRGRRGVRGGAILARPSTSHHHFLPTTPPLHASFTHPFSPVHPPASSAPSACQIQHGPWIYSSCAPFPSPPPAAKDCLPASSRCQR